jgi:hypothetical protein
MRRVEPIQLAHGDVHHHDLRPQLVRERDGFVPILRLADDREAFLFEDRPQSIAHHLVIIDEQDPHVFTAVSSVVEGAPFRSGTRMLTRVPRSGCDAT